jgi:threonyl-tRNA synthetase
MKDKRTPNIEGDGYVALINITLPDGTVNEYASGITCAEVVTDVLGRKHGCLAANVDGIQRDMSFEIAESCSVEGILSESNEGIHILRHSAAHRRLL